MSFLFSKRAIRTVVVLYTVEAAIGLFLSFTHPSIVAQVLYTPTTVVATYLSLCFGRDWVLECK